MLIARDLSYTYHGRPTPDLRAVSLEARAGECLLVTGPSGCGKSTLARCLVGLIPHLYKGDLRGAVWVDGLPTAETPLWRLVERAGMALQNPQAQMLASSVEDELVFGLENLGLPADAIAARLNEALAHFGLTHLRTRDPRRLSGGEGQRLMLAAALARRSPILVLDEPLSMLDTTAAAGLVRDLAGLADQGRAVVVCEHRSRYFRAAGPFREFRLGEAAPADPPGAPPPAPLRDAAPFALSIRGLRVSFGERCVLDGLNLELPAGQIVALVGVNGSGKTTLLRALAGLQSHAGAVEIAGGRPDLALVFQNPDLQLFNATLREELRYGLAEPDEALYAWLLGALGLARYEHSSPLLLSEGEKKRLCLGLALMRRPRHGVLLDEPTLGQDDHHRALLGQTARGLAAAGRLVLTATHDLAWALAYATRLLLLCEGRIIADGAPAALLRDADLWRRVGLLVPDWIWEGVA